MFDFCPNCGHTPGGQQRTVGQKVICPECGHVMGLVPAPPENVVVDRTEEILQSGKAARCPSCHQAVQVKNTGGVRGFVPHFQAGQRKMCPLSGKPIAAEAPPPHAAAPEPRPAAGKDLSAYYMREVIKVVACRRAAEPTIEELTLQYLDKSDRVRLQIDALRDILGKTFAIKPYPAELKRPQLAVWGNTEECVVAKKHEQGGYQPMSETELQQVVEDLRGRGELFF